ncbi:MAG: hypothetical protein LIO96_00870, partial [Lachnospiraceae bacterium]|nr:hypothetical protein [Lachnospiraceae bacterium]
MNRLKTEALAFQPDDGRVKQARKATEIFDALFEDLQTFYNLFQSGCLRQAVDQLRVDMGETYADVAAILTLQLFPEEYLLAFLRSDNHKERYPDGGVNLTHPLMLRCYVVMTAVGNVAPQQNPGLCCPKEWMRSSYDAALIATIGAK